MLDVCTIPYLTYKISDLWALLPTHYVGQKKKKKKGQLSSWPERAKKPEDHCEPHEHTEIWHLIGTATPCRTQPGASAVRQLSSFTLRKFLCVQLPKVTEYIISLNIATTSEMVCA